MQRIDLAFACKLPPAKAIEYFRSKGYAISWDWHETMDEAHDFAFTIAKCLRLDVLQDIHDAMLNAEKNGIGFAEWAKDLAPLLQAKGWWGKVEQENPRTGAMQTVQLGSLSRLRTIYDTNLQQSMNAGRWKSQSENVDSRPYVERVEIDNERTCQPCRDLSGTVCRFDDPIHQQFGGMLHFRCHGSWRALTPGEVTARGLDVETGHGKIAQVEVPVSEGSPVKGPASVYINPQGQTIRTQPGFSYNPGRAQWRPDLKKYSPEIRKLAQ